MNICVQFFGALFFPFLFSTYLGMKLIGHIVTLCLTSLGTAKIFSIMAAQTYIPTSELGFHILTNTYFYLILIVVILVDVK